MPRWTINKTALFRDLGYTPHEGQRPIHESKARIRVVACGTRFGKSTAAAMEAIVELLAPRPRSLGWLVAPTLDLTERVFQRVAHCVQTKLQHHVTELDLRERRIVLRNLAGGLSEVQCKSADYPVTLLGEGLHWLVVDEAARLRPEIWSEYLAPRLIDFKGSALLLSTPRGKDWFWRLYVRGKPGRDADHASWALPTWTNPALDRDVIESQRDGLGAETFAQEYGAQFVGEFEGRCELCGAPDPNVPTTHFGEAPEDGYAECPDCGFPTDANGHTLIAWIIDGRPSPIVRLVMRPRTDGTIPTVERCTPVLDDGRRTVRGGESSVEVEA